MERLTLRSSETSHENGVCCTHFKSKECLEVGGNCAYGCKWEEAAWERLADYEDSLMSPKQCADSMRLTGLLRQRGVTVERVVELIEADKDGRVTVRQCKTTDTLYVVGENQIVKCGISDMYLKDDGTIDYIVNFNCDGECDGCPFNSWARETISDEYHCDGEWGISTVNSNAFGKSVFLSAEEATQKLTEVR